MKKPAEAGYICAMESRHWGLLLAPLAALALGALALGIKLAIARYMPNCWLKRALLRERIRSGYSESNRRVLDEAARHPGGKS
jgi:hypothetical protein